MSENTIEATEVEDNVTETPDTAAEDAITDIRNSDEAETFPREVVEQLRKENGKYRTRAQQADQLAHRLHTELVRATGRLADPSDLPFDQAHLDDPEQLVTAVTNLLEAKPHLASRRPIGDAGQGNRGGTGEPFSLLGKLKDLV